jgi:hypothetical protein
MTKLKVLVLCFPYFTDFSIVVPKSFQKSDEISFASS